MERYPGGYLDRDSRGSGTPRFRTQDIRMVTAHGLHIARSYLYPRDARSQDPLSARQVIAETMQQHDSDVERAAALIDGVYANRRRDAESRAKWGAVGTIIGGAALSIAGARGTDVATAAIRSLGDLHEQLRADRSAIEAKLALAADPSTMHWTPDGVRLHVFQMGIGLFDISTNAARFGPGWYAHYDHTRFLVRVIAGDKSCTGAKIGPRTILTNQHCVRNRPGAPVSSGLRVQQEWMTSTGNGGLEDGFGTETTVYRVELETDTASVLSVSPEAGDWNADPSHDWAVLTISRDVPEGNWLGLVSSRVLGVQADLDTSAVAMASGLMVLGPKERSITLLRRIAIAGYSGDIDGGRYLTMDWGCSVIRVKPGEVLTHRCNGWRGSSGSPIVASNGRYKGQVVGVHAFGFGTGSSTNRTGGGPTADQIIEYLQANPPPAR